MEELKFLLNNFLVDRDKNRDIYFAIRDNYDQFKKFIEECLKYRIIVRADFIKLEKFPGTPHLSMGIRDFETILDYNIFLDILYFLDSRESGAQFLFSELRESIKLDWMKRSNWIALKRVLGVVLEIPIMREIDRSKNGEEEEEILLESLGNSRYIISSDYMGNLKDEIDLETKVYRDLVMKSAVYSRDLEVYEYCKRHRETIQKNLEKFLGWNLQLHKNFILPVLTEKAIVLNNFPTRSELSKIVLQFNKMIREKVTVGKFIRDKEDVIYLTMEEFESLIEEIKEKNGDNWTKLYREKKISSIGKELIEEMSFFNFIELDGEYIRCYPLCGKIVGEYGER